MRSNSRSRIRSAELVLLDLASHVEDHNGDRCSMSMSIANEALIRGNIHFDQLVKAVCCMPDQGAADLIIHREPLDLLHLIISCLQWDREC